MSIIPIGSTKALGSTSPSNPLLIPFIKLLLWQGLFHDGFQNYVGGVREILYSVIIKLEIVQNEMTE